MHQTGRCTYSGLGHWKILGTRVVKTERFVERSSSSRLHGCKRTERIGERSSSSRLQGCKKTQRFGERALIGFDGSGTNPLATPGL